ncbi:hypothetical protein E9840_04305 [Tissierella creatinini]|nr:hypothetical protein E9840_04305 [Tissierella creatinini]TJX66328.1 hypothetical protein E8P77_08030 [Soehngenia saccharolytica]
MKKLICSIFTVVLVMSLFVPVSFAAAEDYPWVLEEVEKTNAEIAKMVDEAKDEVEDLDDTDKRYEKDLKKIIHELKKDTDKIAKEMIKEAVQVEIEVVCEYVTEVIGGQEVLIDPLRILGF